MAKQEQREIALNFITNAEETKSKVDALLNSLDKTDDSYAELEQQSASLESAIIDVNNAMNNNTGSSNILQNSIKKLEGETNKATTSLTNVKKATDNQTKASSNLTKEITANGGAMSILDTLTGGLASQFKNAYEATGLFNTSINQGTIFQRAYTAVVGTSTGALAKFKIALATTGIGLAVVAVGALASYWEDLTDAIIGSNSALRDHRELQKQANTNVDNYNKALEDQITRLNNIISDEDASVEVRARALIQLQELIGVTNKYTLSRAKLSVEEGKAVENANSYTRTFAGRLTILKDLEESTEVYNKSLERQTELEDKIKEMEERGPVRQFLYDATSLKMARSLEKYKEDLKIVNNDLVEQSESLQDLQGKLLYWDQKIEEVEEATKATETNTKSTEDNTQAIYDLNKANLELRRLYYINTSENVAVKLLREEEVEIQKLLDAKKEQLEQNKLLLKFSKEAYDKANQDTNNYYNNEIAKSEERVKVLKVNEEQFNSILLNNSELLKNGSYENLKQIEDNVDSFINTISDPEIQQAYLQVFNVDKVRELSSFIKQFQPELQKYVTDLMDYNVTIFDPLKIGDEKAIINAIKNTNVNKLQLALENSLSLLKIEEDEAIKKAEILKASGEELANIRKFYADKREEETVRTNGLIVDEERNRTEAIKEIDNIAFDQKVMIADATSNLLGATASLLGEHTAGYKTLAIAQTTIDTYTSAMSAYKGMVQAIPGPVGIAAGAVAAAASVVTGISNVKKILAVETPGGSGGSTPSIAGAIPNVSFVSSSENQIANSVNANTNAQNQEPIKAYVVSGDVNSGAALERNKIESNSI